MRERGEGRQQGDQAPRSLRMGQRARLGSWLGLCSIVAGLAGAACANSSNSSEAVRSASPPEPAPQQRAQLQQVPQQVVPQQVVQRIAPAHPAPAVPSTAEPPAGAQQPNERTGRAPGSEAVTAKHVEAELNRLEAELK
ncbi:MAG TPA: hypothetical protein VFS67_00810 [Polyangiaceae bacterium]|nr:hypothetical protein [Polyangiaceae bacterium]